MVEVFLSRLVTHETKALDVAIGSHTSKVIFNVISSSQNLIVIGLCWLALHNPQVDWCMKSFHFETSKHEAHECETFIIKMYGGICDCACHAPKKKHEDGSMQNLQQKDIDSM
jgi:hypothetical protein